MDILLLLLRLIGIVSLLTITIIVFKRKPVTPLTFIITGVAVATLSYLLVGASFLAVEANYRISLGLASIPLLLIAATLPWFVWMLCLYLCAQKPSIPMIAAFLLTLQLGLDFITASNIHWNCQTVNCLTFPKERFSYGGLVSHTLPMLLKGLFLALAFLSVVLDIFNKSNGRRWGTHIALVIVIAVCGCIFVLEDFVLLFFNLNFAATLQIVNVFMASTLSGVMCLLVWNHWRVGSE